MPHAAALRRRRTDLVPKAAQADVLVTVAYRGEELSMKTKCPQVAKAMLLRKARQYVHQCEGP